MGREESTVATLGHSNVCMRAKMNRYDLSLWDVGKRSLYVEKQKASKFSGQRSMASGQYSSLKLFLSQRLVVFGQF
jgi:hypothetical protein